jgi:uncharacterized membrane protein
VGLYASAFMARKAARGARGQLAEPSVVQRPAARVFGIPNAGIGLVYYAALASSTPFMGNHAVWLAAATASALAAAMSLYLAYSLLFVTKMPCPYCWTSHVANWALAALVFSAR